MTRVLAALRAALSLTILSLPFLPCPRRERTPYFQGGSGVIRWILIALLAAVAQSDLKVGHLFDEYAPKKPPGNDPTVSSSRRQKGDRLFEGLAPRDQSPVEMAS